MRHSMKLIPLIMLVLLLGGTLAGCRSEPAPVSLPTPGIGVNITADTCPNVVVQVGNQVTWTNQDSSEHVVRHTPANGPAQFDSGTLSRGDQFTFTFPETAVYTYTCSPDSAQTGTITVEQ